MPRTAKIDDDATNGATVHASPVNGMNEGALKGFVSEYEHEQAQIDEIMDNAKAACQPHIDQQKAIAKAAAEAGVEKKPFRAKIRERALKRRAEGCRGTLSEAQQAIFDEISQKLGDWNLFEAALRN